MSASPKIGPAAGAQATIVARTEIMSTRRHVHEIELPAPPEEVFALLHTPSAIRQWWSASRAIVLPRQGGVWAAAWGEEEDDPEYITVFTIEAFEPPRRLLLGNASYVAKSGPLPFEADFTTEFVVEPTPSGSHLRVTQDGFPAGAVADEYYAACQKGWHDTFSSILRYVTQR
jgi:uncharacterized protein YndB with AHSA1/START domain